MILPLFIAMAAVILGFTIVTQRRTADASTVVNEELNKYYELENAPQTAQIKQLIKSAKMHITLAERLNKRMQLASDLYDAKLVSGSYYKKMLKEEEELLMAKFVIESEAEMLKPGLKDRLFSEAQKLPEPKAAPKKRLFDEAIFMKRRDMLRQDLVKHYTSEI